MITAVAIAAILFETQNDGLFFSLSFSSFHDFENDYII